MRVMLVTVCVTVFGFLITILSVISLIFFLDVGEFEMLGPVCPSTPLPSQLIGDSWADNHALSKKPTSHSAVP